MADVKKLAEELVSLTVKQVQELADVLKADYGIEPAAAAVVVAAGGGGAEAALLQQAALALLDSVARLQPGVLSDPESHHQDSFNPALDGLLDCPHYTRPEDWAGKPVPDVLLSGHHLNIERWRREQSLALTARHRPDLLDKARAAGLLSKQDERYLTVLGDQAIMAG